MPKAEGAETHRTLQERGISTSESEELGAAYLKSYAGRRTKFAPVKSLDSSEFSSEFSDLKTLQSNVKVNPVIS